MSGGHALVMADCSAHICCACSHDYGMAVLMTVLQSLVVPDSQHAFSVLWQVVLTLVVMLQVLECCADPVG